MLLREKAKTEREHKTYGFEWAMLLGEIEIFEKIQSDAQTPNIYNLSREKRT